MTTEANKEVVRRAIDARNRNDLNGWVALFADDLKERVGRGFASTTESFPDVHITAEEMIAEGDKVVLRWSYRATHGGTYQGVAATGKTVEWKGIDIWEVKEEKVTGVLREADNQSLLDQLTPDAA